MEPIVAVHLKENFYTFVQQQILGWSSSSRIGLGGLPGKDFVQPVCRPASCVPSRPPCTGQDLRLQVSFAGPPEMQQITLRFVGFHLRRGGRQPQLGGHELVESVTESEISHFVWGFENWSETR